MALKMNVLSSTGLEINNAYLTIDEYHCYGDKVFATIRAYVSKEMQELGNAPIEGLNDIVELTCDYSENAKNTKIQIYGYLKTLEKYAGAVDVLE